MNPKDKARLYAVTTMSHASPNFPTFSKPQVKELMENAYLEGFQQSKKSENIRIHCLRATLLEISQWGIDPTCTAIAAVCEKALKEDWKE